MRAIRVGWLYNKSQPNYNYRMKISHIDFEFYTKSLANKLRQFRVALI